MCYCMGFRHHWFATTLKLKNDFNNLKIVCHTLMLPLLDESISFGNLQHMMQYKFKPVLWNIAFYTQILY